MFPNLDLSALTNLRADSEQPSASEVTTATRYVRSQPAGQSYLLRLQGLLRHVRTENATAGDNDDHRDLNDHMDLENGVHGGVVFQGPTNVAGPLMSSDTVDRVPDH